MTYSKPSLATAILLLLLALSPKFLQGQIRPWSGKDSVKGTKLEKPKDTVPAIISQKKEAAKEKLQPFSNIAKQLPDSLIKGSARWLEERRKITREKLRSTGNSIISTPPRLKMKKCELANRIPLRVTFWSRLSNSSFKDITSLNIAFDAGTFRNQLQAATRNRLLKLTPNLKDSITEISYGIKKIQLVELEDLMKNRFSPQALVEANQILKIPGITWKQEMPDSVNFRMEAEAGKSFSKYEFESFQSRRCRPEL